MMFKENQLMEFDKKIRKIKIKKYLNPSQLIIRPINKITLTILTKTRLSFQLFSIVDLIRKCQIFISQTQVKTLVQTAN